MQGLPEGDTALATTDQPSAVAKRQRTIMQPSVDVQDADDKVTATMSVRHGLQRGEGCSLEEADRLASAQRRAAEREQAVLASHR